MEHCAGIHQLEQELTLTERAAMAACHALLLLFLPARSSPATRPLEGPRRSNALGKDTTAAFGTVIELLRPVKPPTSASPTAVVERASFNR